MSRTLPPSLRKLLSVPVALVAMLAPAATAGAVTPGNSVGAENGGAPSISAPAPAPDDVGAPAGGATGRRI